MLADSEPDEECYHSPNWVKAKKAKQKYGGVKWVSNPCVRVKDKVVYHSDGECSYLPSGSYPIVEEWHCTLGRTKPELTANARGCASLKEQGWMNPVIPSYP